MRTRSLVICSLAVLGVIGCGGPGAPTERNSTASNAKGSSTPVVLSEGKDVDVMVFKGGFGSDFYETAAAEFQAKHPGVTVNVEGDPHIWDRVRPLFLKGTPPDLTYPGWDLDHWALVAEGQVLEMDQLLKETPAQGSGTWGDTFEPSILKLGKYEGKQYVMPYFFSVMGWWYDANLFEENGWTPPKSFSELKALNEKIKAKGMAPITYQGQYPDYMIAGMLQPWIISVGGETAFNDIQNLKPGAWKSEAVIKAAQMIRELKDSGAFQNGAPALSHTEAQTQFLTGKAAMVPCGTWLHSEMEKSIPKGTRMAFMLPPVADGGTGDPTNVMIKIEPWFIPSKAKSQRNAVDYFKYLTSLDKAKQFVKEKGTFMSIKGANDVELPDYLSGAANAFKSSKYVWASQWQSWYRELYKSVETNVTSLANGQITPEEFAERCEAAAEKTRRDPDILKHSTE